MKKIIISVMAMLSIVAFAQGKQKDGVIYDAVLGDVVLDGKSLRQMLIANGFAREYYGEAKQSWCN